MKGAYPRLPRAAFAFVHDLAMVALAFVLALSLRLADTAYSAIQAGLWQSLITFVTVSGLTFLAFGLYRGIWRYASLSDLVAIVKAVSVATLLFLLVSFLSTRLEALPRSVLIINWFVLIAGLSASRMTYRLIKDHGFRHVLERRSGLKIPVVLIGAGDAAETFLREMSRSPRAPYEVLALIDIKGSRVGRQIHGVPVVAGLQDLSPALDRLARRERVPQRLIATQAFEAEVLDHLLRVAEDKGLTLSVLPSLTDLQSPDGMSRLMEPRPIAIEDLLGRNQASLDRLAMRGLIEGRRVLVTGAGGSIGSELTRQIAALGPARLALLDASEFALYSIDREIGEKHSGLTRRAYLADVRDAERLRLILQEERPDLVFHAAALKHVPLVEDNPLEALQTNVLGTRRLAEACRQAGVTAMVMISSDKAVNPSSIMGATKRLAESFCQSLDVAERKRRGTRFVTVRFGNVLGSTGSVVPLFRHQIAQGGPITITHPDMTRYFMTIREAVELVLQASVMSLTEDGDAGRISVLDMGKPVKIVDLAEQMIRLAGLTPGKDIALAFTGLRPGEKLHEELFHTEEALTPTRHPSLRLAAPRVSNLELLGRSLDEMAVLCEQQNRDAALALLSRLVPEYLGSESAARNASA